MNNSPENDIVVTDINSFLKEQSEENNAEKINVRIQKTKRRFSKCRSLSLFLF